MIMIFIFLRFLKQFETLILRLNLPCLIKNIAGIIIIFNANWPCIISFLAAYVEVSLIHESRVLKQKKTLTKDPSGNPVFNETLTFHIPVGILHQTSLLVAVKNENAQRTEDQLLGRIFLGPTATGNQFEHWNEMRINNKPIARWHKLLDWHLIVARWRSTIIVFFMRNFVTIACPARRSSLALCLPFCARLKSVR